MESAISRSLQSLPISSNRFKLSNPRRIRSTRLSKAPAAANNPETFLSAEEAGLIEMSGLGIHERFLARLTVSSLNLLKVIAKQEGRSMESLNAGIICDWFVKDKAKGMESATLKWGEEEDALP